MSDTIEIKNGRMFINGIEVSFEDYSRIIQEEIDKEILKEIEVSFEDYSRIIQEEIDKEILKKFDLTKSQP